MRRYDDPVEVRRGWVSSSASDGLKNQQGQEGPEQFLWRGRLWKVRTVVAQWVETGPWWLGADARATRSELVGADAGPTSGPTPSHPRSMGELLDECEMWRVEASRAMGTVPGSSGVFDLSFSWSDASWRLVGCVD